MSALTHEEIERERIMGDVTLVLEGGGKDRESLLCSIAAECGQARADELAEQFPTRPQEGGAL